MTDKLKIYVGYDKREDIAWQVCRSSILQHAAEAPEIYPLKQDSLRELGLYTRPMDKGAATEFSLTRFLTPHLADSDGWVLFVDCDFLFTTDIARLTADLDPGKAVYCVQHDYVPRTSQKMDGQVQTTYPRKNWSSFILFNGAHPAVRTLTPRVVNTESPAYLHRLSWADDDAIGNLPLAWNFLEGEYDPPAELPHAIHYTNGGPWFPNCQDVDYADLWIAARDRYLNSVSSTAA
ncbi:MAG: glycosyltransferase [Methylobacterium frigidaeris]